MRFFVFFCVLAGLLLASATNAESSRVSASPKHAVLVTGASSGIGYRIAQRLAGSGYYVYAGARKPEDIDRLSRIPNMQGIKLDVTIQGDIDQAVSVIEKDGRGLYGLVNNAGVALFDALIEISEEDMRFLMDVNLFGPYRVTKAFAPLIMASKGRIITTGSLSGILSSRFFGPYSMSKHAMEAYTDALAQEMEKFGVEVGIVEPGNFNSKIMENMQRRIERLNTNEKVSLYQEEMTRFANFTQMDRSHHKDPAPVAEAVLKFFLSENPKHRYMVTPNAAEAHLTIERSMQRLVQLNTDQPYSLSRAELIVLLDQVLVKEQQ